MPYPIKLTPAFKDYIWGGDRLKAEYNMTTPLSPLAEAWVLSCHPDGENTCENGVYAGKTLSSIVGDKSLLGTAAAKFDSFPVLTKLIDAKADLSVQVHPDNDYALAVEGEYGKTEMWCVLDCAPDAFLYYGFAKTVSKEEFADRIKNNTLCDILNKVRVKKGDVFFIAAGTIHAICAGIVIAEIQQNSNTTYRVYDYGRVGADGKTRPLHVEKALNVTKLSPENGTSSAVGEVETMPGYSRQMLSKCEYFTVYRYDVQGDATVNCDETSFHNLLVIDGEGELTMPENRLPLRKGDSFFIPAGSGDYLLSGSLSCLISRV